MSLTHSKIAIAAAMLAATSMTALPASAAQLPASSSSSSSSAAQAGAYDKTAEDAANYRYRRHRRGVDAGDVIAGVFVLGAIAAIASSANNRDDDRYRDRARTRERDPRYRSSSRTNGSWSAGGIDNAVDMCVGQVERGRDRVESVDNAQRDSSGWRVSGSMNNGDYFTCRIDNDGRIRSIDLGDDYAAAAPADQYGQYGQYDQYGAPVAASGPQLSDDVYADARASNRYRGETQGVVPTSSGASSDQQPPAYPGGPLPGEEGYEDSLGG